MKKTLLMCVLAVSVAGCVEHRRDEYAANYEYVSTYTTGCSSCAQTVTTCTTCLQPVIHQQPKTVVVVLPPAPQPIIEQEIIYQPRPTCGCNKCACKKAATQK